MTSEAQLDRDIRDLRRNGLCEPYAEGDLDRPCMPDCQCALIQKALNIIEMQRDQLDDLRRLAVRVTGSADNT